MRNEVDQHIHEVGKQVAEHGDKLSDEDKQAIETAREELEKAAEGDDKAAIEAALENYKQKSQKLGEILYQEAQQEAAAQGGGAEVPAAEDADGAATDEPVDADFEVKS